MLTPFARMYARLFANLDAQREIMRRRLYPEPKPDWALDPRGVQANTRKLSANWTVEPYELKED